MLREYSAMPASTGAGAQTPPVIFLDIDGVLRRGTGNGDRRVDRDLLERFHRLIGATDARVVLASTWRHSRDGLADAHRLGIPFEDVLPDLRPNSRANEVKAWLAAHPKTRRFAILDDENDGYGVLPLFQPNANRGLTSELASKVEAYLKGERNEAVRRNVFVTAWQALKFAVAGHKG